MKQLQILNAWKQEATYTQKKQSTDNICKERNKGGKNTTNKERPRSQKRKRKKIKEYEDEIHAGNKKVTFQEPPIKITPHPYRKTQIKQYRDAHRRRRKTQAQKYQEHGKNMRITKQMAEQKTRKRNAGTHKGSRAP